MLDIQVDWKKQFLKVRETRLRKCPVLRFAIQCFGGVIKGEHMSFPLPDDRTATIFVFPVDAAEAPAVVDGPPTWQVADPAIVTLSVADDGLSAVATPTKPIKLGITNITVTADADVGEGVEEIASSLEVEVVGGKAVGLNIKAVVN